MGTEQEPESGDAPQAPRTTATKKRWWVAGAAAVAVAFLGALGTWAFGRLAPILDRPFEAAPLEVYVDDAPRGCDIYAIPASILADVPVVPVDDGDSFQLAEIDGEWVVDHGGLPATTRAIGLTMHGVGDETVVIHSIDLVDFTPIDPGEEIVQIYECLPVGGEMDVSSLTADFAELPPVLHLTDPDLHFPYEVSMDDPEVFDVRVSKAGQGDEQVCFCRWNIGITWSAGSESQVLVVKGDAIGVATAIPSVEWTSYWYVDGEWSTELIAP